MVVADTYAGATDTMGLSGFPLAVIVDDRQDVWLDNDQPNILQARAGEAGQGGEEGLWTGAGRVVGAGRASGLSGSLEREEMGLWAAAGCHWFC
jgi:hypothetical protein